MKQQQLPLTQQLEVINAMNQVVTPIRININKLKQTCEPTHWCNEPSINDTASTLLNNLKPILKHPIPQL